MDRFSTKQSIFLAKNIDMIFVQVGYQIINNKRINLIFLYELQKINFSSAFWQQNNKLIFVQVAKIMT